jgi:hypothetical protein
LAEPALFSFHHKNATATIAKSTTKSNTVDKKSMTHLAKYDLLIVTMFCPSLVLWLQIAVHQPVN